MEGPPRYPLEIFPKEIWEIIILKVKDSEDLRNLMKASKQLNDTFMGIRHFWLLDKVLPILTTKPTCKKKQRYLGAKDVKNLRLVDKRWCGAVDAFLENQPNLRPYNKDDDKLNSEKHIWSGRSYQDEAWHPTTIGRVNLDTDECKFDEVLETMQKFGDSERNPFPSRSIIREPQSDCGDGGDPRLWVESEKDIGKHVWFLALEWAVEEDVEWQVCTPRLMWKVIVNSLTFLPNLKGLHLEIKHLHCFSMYDDDDDAGPEEFLQSEENQLPPAPFLESLTITKFNEDELCIPDLFSQQLMSKYFLQLRRLQISSLAWETRQKWMFPNLTELSLEDIRTSVKVTEILKSLEAPQLAKIRLACWRRNTSLNMEEDIFPWIALFPSLLHLDVSCTWLSISESGTLSPQQDSKLSLKYLKIHNSPGVNYNFLRCLPSLQRLQVSVDKEPIVRDCSAYPEVKIKLEIESSSLYQSNVWDICPKLRTISMYTGCIVENYYNYTEFDRATYEKLRNSPDLSGQMDLRRDIRDFLDFNLWYGPSESNSDDWETGDDDE